MNNQRDWAIAHEQLSTVMNSLGFNKGLADAIAKQLGSPKAIYRMVSYLENVKPKSEELVVDEMLAITSEIDAWREKKASQLANANYNEMRYMGIFDEI
ncbi:MAG: hypothetical protein K5773_00865 [Pseudobutyrivibrio sp.]|nr:hypothetical protein [Pseudobutyrivibrio sp.]